MKILFCVSIAWAALSVLITALLRRHNVAETIKIGQEVKRLTYTEMLLVWLLIAVGLPLSIVFAAVDAVIDWVKWLKKTLFG